MDHNQIIKEQDEQLSEIEQSVKRIRTNAKLIDATVDEQKNYIKEMDQGMDKTQTKMGNAMKKIGNLLQTQSKGQIKFFLTLCCTCIIMILVLIIF